MVLSLGDQPGLVSAVRSLAEQEPEPELVVVNSGGGARGRTLRRAGLDVTLRHHEGRLLPGGARNAGIDATSARYVAFLAADSVAEPGWVAGRLRAHEAGYAAVACALTVAPQATRSAQAAHLLLHHRRRPDTPPSERLLYGLSYERALFERFGRFREDLRIAEDTEFNRRLEGVSVAWAPDVRTRHEGPSSPRALMRDQYARGRRRMAIARRFGSPEARRETAIGSALVAAHALRQAARASDPVERRRLLGSWPLLLPAAFAYLMGGLAEWRGPK